MTSVIVASPAFPTVDHDHHDADDKCHHSIPCIFTMTMISITVAPPASPTVPNVTFEMCRRKEKDADDRHDDCKDADDEG